MEIRALLYPARSFQNSWRYIPLTLQNEEILNSHKLVIRALFDPQDPFQIYGNTLI